MKKTKIPNHGLYSVTEDGRVYSSGVSQMGIKRELGIPQPTVSAIVRRERWSNI